MTGCLSIQTKNTNFYYSRVKNWLNEDGKTAKGLDLVIVFVNIDIERWMAATIDMRAKQLVSFDSLKNVYPKNALENLKRRLVDCFPNRYVSGFVDVEVWEVTFRLLHLHAKHMLTHWHCCKERETTDVNKGNPFASFNSLPR